MGLNRYDAKRDENEPEIVAALRKAGYLVTPLSSPGVPDLLVIKPWHRNRVFVAETPEQALEQVRNGMMTLIEVKMPGKGLNKKQQEWHGSALNETDTGTL